MRNEVSRQRLQYIKQNKRRKYTIHGIQIILLVAFLGIWELFYVAGWSDSFVTSSPSKVVKTLVSLIQTDELWKHIGVSCMETIIGFLVGTIVGTIIAAIMWYCELVAKILEPFLIVINALPKTALGPIFIVWIGANTESIIVMTLTISLIVTIMNMYQGFCQTSIQKIQLLKTFEANRMQLLRYLVVPSNYGTLLNTLKVNIGLAWVGVIMGEFLVSKAGLGYLIVYGSQVFNMDLVIASIVVLAICAGCMYFLMLMFERIISNRMGIKI